MQYRLFGKSGLRVSEACLGTMTFGEEWGWGSNKDESQKVFEAFAEAGGNFIDTANLYTNGTSEKLVGEFVANDRDRFVLASKYSLTMDPSHPNGGGNHRKNMMSAVEASLKRMNTDYMDILWVHAWDFCTPVEEVMRGLNDLVSQGKVHYIGVSDTPAWVVSQANTMANLRGWSSFTGLQLEYNLIQRTPERELLPMAHEFEMAVTTWGPLGGGVLTGKYLDGRPQNVRHSEGEFADAYVTERNNAIAKEVVAIAKDLGKSPAQVAIAWIRNQGKGLTLPIIGARTVEQLKDNLGALELTLSKEHLERLDKVSKVDLGFPHDFLSMDSVRFVLYGETYNKLNVSRH